MKPKNRKEYLRALRKIAAKGEKILFSYLDLLEDFNEAVISGKIKIRDVYDDIELSDLIRGRKELATMIAGELSDL